MSVDSVEVRRGCTGSGITGSYEPLDCAGN